MERLLPIGTIVQARWTDQHAVRMMIAGYYPKNKKNGKIYDYLTVFYPMGLSFSDGVQGLNRGAILKIEAMGFEDEHTKEYLQGMGQILEAAEQKVQDFRQEGAAAAQPDLPKEKDQDPLEEWFL